MLGNKETFYLLAKTEKQPGFLFNNMHIECLSCHRSRYHFTLSGCHLFGAIRISKVQHSPLFLCLFIVAVALPLLMLQFMILFLLLTSRMIKTGIRNIR